MKTYALSQCLAITQFYNSECVICDVCTEPEETVHDLNITTKHGQF